MADVPLLSGVFDKLDEFQKQVIDDKIIGHGLKHAVTPAQQGLMPSTLPGLGLVGELARWIPQADAAAATAQGLRGKEWVDSAYKNAPWQHFVTGAILDPTNLIGFGLPGKLATLAPSGGRLARGLQAANTVDALPGKITGAGLDAVTKGLRGGLQLGADALGPLVPRNPALDRIGSGFNKATQLWRDQALISPPFHIGNYTGNVEAALRSGDMDVLKATLKAPFTGRDKSVTDILTNIGNNRAPLTYASGGAPPPIDPLSFGSRWSEQTQKIGREPNINNPLTSPSAFRDLPSNKFTNPVRDAMANVSEASRRFGSERVEGPAIDAAFKKDFLPRFKQHSNDFFHDLQRAVDPATGARPPEVQQAIDAFKTARGQLSPDDLREILSPGTRARRAAAAANPNPRTARAPRAPDWRDELVNNWENRIIDSMEAGSKKSTDIFFDYTANNPIDKLGQQAFAFHRFPINSIPKTLRAAGRNPVYANVPGEYYRVSDEYNQQRGLPRAFHGRMPLGSKLPNGMQATVDPFHYSPFGALIKNVTRPSSTVDDQGSPLGQVLDDFRDVGLGLNPLIDLPLHAAGVYGRDMTPGLLRWSQPINAAAGVALKRPVDIEGGLKSAIGGAQEQVTGQQPFPYQEYLLNKRRSELKNRGIPEWRAEQDVANQLGAEGLLGFTGVLPGIKFLTDEERQIRSNAALAKAYRLAGNVEAAGDNPTKNVYRDLDPRDWQISHFDELSPAEQERLLRDPEAQQKLLAKLARDLHQKKAKPAPPGMNPFGKYEAKAAALR